MSNEYATINTFNAYKFLKRNNIHYIYIKTENVKHLKVYTSINIHISALKNF